MQSAIVVERRDDEKVCRRAKNRKSRRRQRQSGLQKTELLQHLQLGARHCHVGQHYAIGVVADSKFGLWAYSWA